VGGHLEAVLFAWERKSLWEVANLKPRKQRTEEKSEARKAKKRDKWGRREYETCVYCTISNRGDLEMSGPKGKGSASFP